jgi:hypothetical protein
VDTVNIIGIRVVAARQTAMSRNVAHVGAGSEIHSIIGAARAVAVAARLTEALGRGKALSGDALRPAKSAWPG